MDSRLGDLPPRSYHGTHDLTVHHLHLPMVLDYQRKALFGPERYAVVEGSTKAGKTYPCIVWLLEQMGTYGGEGRRFWWIGPTHKQSEIAYTRTRDMLRKSDPRGDWFEARDHRKDIKIDGLGMAEYLTGEEPDNLYGEDVWAAVMDEFTRQREEAFHAVRSTLTATGGRLRLIGNVKGRKNWGWKLARQAQSGTPNMAYGKFTADQAVAAGIIPQSEIDDARARLPHAVFRELYYAEPSDDGGNPFGLSHIEACYAPEPLSGVPVCFGFDLAKSVDWTVVVGMDAAGRVVYLDRWQQLPWSETTKRIVAIIGDKPAEGDSTGVGDPILEDIRRQCRRVNGYKFTSQSKQQLMEGLAVAIQGQTVRFHDPVLRAELESFEYQVGRTHVSYSAPEGLHDDCVVALALAVKAWTATANRPERLVSVVTGETAKRIPDVWGDMEGGYATSYESGVLSGR